MQCTDEIIVARPGFWMLLNSIQTPLSLYAFAAQASTPSRLFSYIGYPDGKPVLGCEMSEPVRCKVT
jgi:hypothetical protein